MSRTPEPLPSIPPSPSPTPSPKPPEEVAKVWHEDDPPRAKRRKGKQRARRARRGGSDDDDDDDDDDEEEEELNGNAEYPPTKEEEAESRRVQENLRRWEVAERQRRKAARESVASTSAGSTAPSLLAELRTSLFRRDSARKVPISGVGTHQALRTDDRYGDPEDSAEPTGDMNSLPLADMHTPTTADTFPAPLTPTPEAENPFDTPSASRTSLNVPVDSAIMTESDSIPAFAEGSNSNTATPQKGKSPGPRRPTIEASTSFAQGAGSPTAKKQHPPPKPLDLPAPRSPPPSTGTPQAGKPPDPTSPPRVAPVEPEPEPIDEGPPVRWWHEWLCGCGEGGDRQAGRTNPFE